jgi:hypothetical protein
MVLHGLGGGHSEHLPILFTWANFAIWCFCRFSTHSSHSSLESFHHLKQTSSVTEYIQKFEELMALM